jgi:hypothetical protein
LGAENGGGAGVARYLRFDADHRLHDIFGCQVGMGGGYDGAQEQT